MNRKFDFSKVVRILNNSQIVSSIEIKDVDEVGIRGVYKIRCTLLPSKYKLEIRFVQTETENIYSYQLFSENPIIRWDNAPHYPKIKTYPHHFHIGESNVVESNLTGNTINDLQKVLIIIKDLLEGHVNSG